MEVSVKTIGAGASSLAVEEQALSYLEEYSQMFQSRFGIDIKKYPLREIRIALKPTSRIKNDRWENSKGWCAWTEWDRKRGRASITLMCGPAAAFFPLSPVWRNDLRHEISNHAFLFAIGFPGKYHHQIAKMFGFY